MLSLLSEDLKITKKVLEEAYYPEIDSKKIREELHRILGGVVYLKLPQLEKALRDFQRVVKAEPQSKKELEIGYNALRKAIENFWLEVRRISEN